MNTYHGIGSVSVWTTMFFGHAVTSWRLALPSEFQTAQAGQESLGHDALHHFPGTGAVAVRIMHRFRVRLHGCE